MRNGSRPEYFRVEGALKLTRMRQSEWRRRWGIQGIIAFNVAVVASADDGWCNASSTFNNNQNRLFIGQAGGVVYESFIRFQNVTVPAGATIQSASIDVVTAVAAGVSMLTNIFFEDADDAVAPTTCAEFDADVRTAASVAWDYVATDGAGTVNTSPDLSTIVQEITDRGSWASGNSMMVIWEDDGSPNAHFFDLASYDHVTYDPPELDIVYSA